MDSLKRDQDFLNFIVSVILGNLSAPLGKSKQRTGFSVIKNIDARLTTLERYFSILQEKKDIEEMYKQEQLERITE